MELKKAQLSGTTSESGNNLQHEAAMRVEARYMAEEKRRRSAQLNKALTNYFILLLFLFIVGGAYYAWHTGILDAVRPALGLGKSPVRYEVVKDEGAEVSASSAESREEKVAHAVERIERHIDAFNAATARFAGATIAYWKDAIPEDKPAANGPPLDYAALVPDAKGGFALLDLTLASDKAKSIKPVKIRKFMRTRDAAVVSGDEFNKMIGKTPFLVLRGNRAYYCSAKDIGRAEFPVPVKGTPFNPSRQEFGALYDLVFKFKFALPTFKYDVSLNHPKFKDNPVATLGFGEDLTREALETAIRAHVGDDKLVAAMLNGKLEFRHAQKR